MEYFFNEVLHQAGLVDTISSFQRIGGGCINNTVRLTTASSHYFLKWNLRAEYDMFDKEAAGLELLNQSFKNQVPAPIHWGIFHDKSYLLMDYIDSGARQHNYWEQFGVSLANMHQISNEKFGLSYPNYIGRLPQSNEWHHDWIAFFISQRLENQLALAYDHGLVDRKLLDRFQNFYHHLDQLLPSEKPALLHGDLWGGNIMDGCDGFACIVDPAVFYGHREAELSFTRLFGGFEQSFYQAYHLTYPLAPGFDERVDIYNLYPLLVHLNLFGLSYLGSIKQILYKFE